MADQIINLAKDFTTKPGPRYEDEGDYSGQVFREEKLKPAFDIAVREKANLIVDLNGTEGYATSFLEEAFGGLARIYGEKAVLAVIRLTCDDDPFIKQEIEQYITEANDPKNARHTL